jgi:rubredoxin
MSNPKTYECEGCGAVFNGTAEDAFMEGWDTPERFLSHCTCPNCTIDKTVWWKGVVLKEPLTEEEIAKIQLFNKMHAEQ